MEDDKGALRLSVILNANERKVDLHLEIRDLNRRWHWQLACMKFEYLMSPTNNRLKSVLSVHFYLMSNKFVYLRPLVYSQADDLTAALRTGPPLTERLAASSTTGSLRPLPIGHQATLPAGFLALT